MSDAINTLEEFNSAADKDATKLITHWCAAPLWASHVCNQRPYINLETLIESTSTFWAQAVETDRLAAFSAHPVIGDAELLRTKYADQANKEQGQVLSASNNLLSALAEQNLAYKQRHGFTFIVFATGKSAQQMLELLNRRINNSTEQELKNASTEQLKIMQLRLNQSFS